MRPGPRVFLSADTANDPVDPPMSRKLAHEIYRLAWPVLIAQLAVMAYAVIDTIMAARFATDDLAAVGIGASIYFSVFVALMGVLLAVSPIVAQLLGAGRYDEIGEQVRQAMWLTLALARRCRSVVPLSGAAAGLEQGATGGRRQGARLPRHRRVGRARGTGVSPVRELHDGGIAAARDDGAESVGPGAENPAQLGFHLRAPRGAGHGSGRLRAVDHAGELDHLHPRLALVRRCRRRIGAMASFRAGRGRDGATSGI